MGSTHGNCFATNAGPCSIEQASGRPNGRISPGWRRLFARSSLSASAGSAGWITNGVPAPGRSKAGFGFCSGQRIHSIFGGNCWTNLNGSVNPSTPVRSHSPLSSSQDLPIPNGSAERPYSGDDGLFNKSQSNDNLGGATNPGISHC